MMDSDEIHFFRHGHDTVRDLARSCLLLSLDIRRFRQRQLLLCHHARLESRPIRDRRGFALRSPAG